MDIQRIDSYIDSRFSLEVLYQHGAFLADGAPWAFRVISDHEAIISAKIPSEAALRQVVKHFRFYAAHITTFYNETGKCLMRLPPIKRREVEIYRLQPSQFSVDREKCEAVGHFIRSAADVIVPVTKLAGGILCVLDGHTRLYQAWRQGIRTAMVFDIPGWTSVGDFVREARRRNVYYVRDMALYSPEEQKEKWHDWCDAYFAAKSRTEEEQA